MSLPGPGTLWRTLRHLRFRQIRYQLAKRLLPTPAARPVPTRGRVLTPRVPGGASLAPRFFDGAATFTFNNESRVSPGWNEPGARKLWLYNLHYMSWLFDLEAPRRGAWIEKWIRENPAASGGTGWEPYPLSLRLFNWSKHYAVTGETPPPAVLESMAAQSGRLLANLEFHLDGNHLLENLFALAHAAFFWDASDPRAARSLRETQRHLEASLREQFLADGGHYELSPMYHAILLERMLDLLNVWPESGDPFPGLRGELERYARAGLDWLDVMTVDGRFALFNDAAYDTAPGAGALLEYGTRLLGWRSSGRAPLRALPASGYYRAEAGPFTVIFDAGPLGPDVQMGHAQGDMLSFCLWVNDVPVLVHPGNYEYVGGAMRDYCRSTAAHNTLTLDGAEQAEWWGSHRVGRRARVLEAYAAIEAGSGEITLRGAHAGFSHLPGRPVHRRTLKLSGSEIRIEDEISPFSGQTSRLYFHFHPALATEATDGGIVARIVQGELRIACDSGLSLGESWFCPEFGMRIRNAVALAEGAFAPFRAVFTWHPRP